MTENKSTTAIHYFVDEAGDQTLFSRKGKILIGSEGCSKFFILGKLDIENPQVLENDLENLRNQLLNDPYFKDVPSMRPERKRTALAFHAHDDPPEIRWEVFKMLRQREVRFYAVVRDKRDILAQVKQKNEHDLSYRYNPNELYDTLIIELFRKWRPLAGHLNIYFSKRGKKDRTRALKAAIEKAEKEFEKNFGFKRKSEVSITASTPLKNVGLQAVDYYLWALQRFYERGEERYIEMLWNQVGEVHDLDFKEKKSKRGAYFLKNKPLNIESRPIK